jgi:hypothetical protein
MAGRWRAGTPKDQTTAEFRWNSFLRYLLSETVMTSDYTTSNANTFERYQFFKDSMVLFILAKKR